MNPSNPHDRGPEFEAAVAKRRKRKPYSFRLYVAGMSPLSMLTIRTIRQLCQERLDHRYELQVIDLYRQPEMARRSQIIAVPTLVRERPKPARKFVGNLADPTRVFAGLI